MSAQSRTIPVEVYLHIISHIPAFNTADLARLLRTSKQLFALVAPALYTSITSPNPSEGPCDLQAWFKKLALDTGLPLSAVGLPEMDDGSDHDEEAGTGDAPPAAVAGPPTAKTVKAHLLDLTRTLTVHERHGGQGADEIDVSKSLDMPRLKHLIMISPGSAAADQAIKTSLRPRIAISTGVSLHGRSSVGVSYCPDRLEECYVLVEPSDPLPSSANRCGKYRTFDQGLQLVQKSLNSSLHQTHRSNREATTITYILAMPPCERYEVPRPFPHSGMMMTMEYSPEYAPGWMHAFTKALGPAVAERLADGTFLGGPSSSAIATTTSIPATEASLPTTKRSLQTKPLVRFVNFGALSGADVGMPQAAMSEITDRLRRSMRIFVRRALHSPLFDDVGVDQLEGIKASVNDKIVWEEMDDWLRSAAGVVDKGKLDVLKAARGDVGKCWARQHNVPV